MDIILLVVLLATSLIILVVRDRLRPREQRKLSLRLISVLSALILTILGSFYAMVTVADGGYGFVIVAAIACSGLAVALFASVSVRATWTDRVFLGLLSLPSLLILANSVTRLLVAYRG